jgi:hypothetical protein
MPAADYRILTDSTGKRIAAAIEAIGGNSNILMPSSSIPIPASGSSASYDMTELTAEHQLVRWNFSSSAENAPPANLTWTTNEGYFTIANTGGTTSESMQPVFALPQAVAITNH